jgi:phosphohistidine phosphatase SixA
MYIENVKVMDLCDGLERIKKFQFPTCQQIWSTLSLLSLTVDSAVSPRGLDQINDMHLILEKEKFWDRKIDQVLCSPLTRAMKTCEGVLPKDRKSIEVKIIDDLEEATIYEHVFSATLLQRIERFKAWLSDCDDGTIVIVGHSQYFKKMLGKKSLMRNCDVWELDMESGIYTYIYSCI